MRNRYLSALIAVGLLLAAGLFAAAAETTAPKKERAVITFTEPVKLLDVFLKGQYMFLHDDQKMAQGEPCSYVYEFRNGHAGRLVASFHCVPVERTKAEHFTVLLSRRSTAFDVPELTEYQFAGSTEGHGVPLIK
jgi:hypothetical protein